MLNVDHLMSKCSKQCDDRYTGSQKVGFYIFIHVVPNIPLFSTRYREQKEE